jgi:putative PIN family toxin of toxin-antitoxin system
MRVIIDTNVLISCIGERTKHHLIWQSFLDEKVTLFASIDILFEYEELVTIKYPPRTASHILDILTDDYYVKKIPVYYYWNAIVSDPDDNKFFDAAVAANADYLVTNDTHFNEVKKLKFPKVNIISADEFLEVLKQPG